MPDAAQLLLYSLVCTLYVMYDVHACIISPVQLSASFLNSQKMMNFT